MIIRPAEYALVLLMSISVFYRHVCLVIWHFKPICIHAAAEMMSALDMEASLPGSYRRFSIYSVKDLESADHCSEDSKSQPDLSSNSSPNRNGQKFNKALKNKDDLKEENHNKEQKDEGGKDTWSLGRLEEYKELQKQKKEFLFDIGVDVFDLFFKTADFTFFMRARDTSDEQEEYFAPLCTALAVALFVIFCATVWRIREIREMSFVANHGYSRRWKKGIGH